jgi:hypothetical protein
MALTDLSEFTFGFAFLFEQANRHWPLKAVPILPSLQQEADQGWDAKLPTVAKDFYYQFKLSDYLANGNAKYIKDGTYSHPYFRFALHPRENNRQHRKLRQLAQTQPDTYYVAPEVHQFDVFTNAYLNGNLTAYSRLIPVKDCPDVSDGRQCYVSYQTGSTAWKFHGSRYDREISILGADLERFYRQSMKQASPLSDRFADDIFQRVRRAGFQALRTQPSEMLDEKMWPEILQDRRRKDTESRRESLIAAAQILHAVFGCTLVLVGEQP